MEGNKSLKKYAVAQYDGSVRYTDHFLGNPFDMFKRKDLMDETIIILTADHGEEFHEHGNWLHYELYNEVLNIPLIIHIPDKTQKDYVNQFTESIDISPTILDILEINDIHFNKQTEGKSLVPLMNNNDIKKEYILSEVDDLRSLIDLDSHLKYYREPPSNIKALYNLKKDFKETYNISSDDKIRRMEDKLEQIEKNQKEITNSKELKEKLRNLDYIQ